MALTDENIKTTENTNDVVGDIDLSATRKKRFRIDGDNDNVIELNVADMNILPRLEEGLPKLKKNAVDAQAKLEEFSKSNDEDVLSGISKFLTQIDADMKDIIDFIFGSKISDKVSGGGNMYDIFNGEFRFEHIINALIKLYENNMESELTKLNSRLNKYTNKYTNTTTNRRRKK